MYVGILLKNLLPGPILPDRMKIAEVASEWMLSILYLTD